MATKRTNNTKIAASKSALSMMETICRMIQQFDKLMKFDLPVFRDIFGISIMIEYNTVNKLLDDLYWKLMHIRRVHDPFISGCMEGIASFVIYKNPSPTIFLDILNKIIHNLCMLNIYAKSSDLKNRNDIIDILGHFSRTIVMMKANRH